MNEHRPASIFWLLVVAALMAAGCGSKDKAPEVKTEALVAQGEGAQGEGAQGEGEEGEGEEAEPEPAVADEDADRDEPAGTGTAQVSTPDVHFVPTPEPVVKKMLEVAEVTKNDLVYDLGCGDGRIVIMAAKKYGARAVGYDIDPERVAEARANVKAAGVDDLVTIEEANIFELDLSPANVITLYLLPSLNVRLIPQLEKLAKGSRIVSHDFDMEGMAHEQFHVVTVKDDDEDESGRDHHVYYWTIPLKPEKD